MDLPQSIPQILEMGKPRIAKDEPKVHNYKDTITSWYKHVDKVELCCKYCHWKSVERLSEDWFEWNKFQNLSKIKVRSAVWNLHSNN